MLTTRFLETLRDTRRQKGLTLHQVSEQFGHNRSWLSRIEAGQRSLSLEDFLRLAALYGVKPSEWVELMEVQQ